MTNFVAQHFSAITQQFDAIIKVKVHQHGQLRKLILLRNEANKVSRQLSSEYQPVSLVWATHMTRGVKKILENMEKKHGMIQAHYVAFKKVTTKGTS
jgi:hypothetical protein